jgi:hypothetical protein
MPSQQRDEIVPFHIASETPSASLLDAQRQRIVGDAISELVLL